MLLNAVANLGYANCCFRNPVFPGDTLNAQSEVIGLKENSSRKTGIVYVRTTGYNQDQKPVLEYVRWVMVRKRDEAAPAPGDHVPRLPTALEPKVLGEACPVTGLPYRAGQYVVLYDGQGTLGYSGDASLVSSAPGRDVINVATPGSAGIMLTITSTDPNHTGNYIHNIRVVYATEESLLAAGNVFRPGFLSMLQKFHAMRFMQWLEIDNDGGILSSWASRPQLTDGGWGAARRAHRSRFAALQCHRRRLLVERSSSGDG